MEFHHHIVQLALTAKGKNHLGAGGILLVKRPAGAFPCDIALERHHFEVLHDKRAGDGGQLLEPLFLDVGAFGLTGKTAYEVFLAIDGDATFFAHGAKHAFACHAVDVVGGGEIRENLQFSSHHIVGYHYALAVGGGIDAGLRLLWSYQPVERCAIRVQTVVNRQCIYLGLQFCCHFSSHFRAFAKCRGIYSLRSLLAISNNGVNPQSGVATCAIAAIVNHKFEHIHSGEVDIYIAHLFARALQATVVECLAIAFYHKLHFAFGHHAFLVAHTAKLLFVACGVIDFGAIGHGHGHELLVASVDMRVGNTHLGAEASGIAV